MKGPKHRHLLLVGLLLPGIVGCTRRRDEGARAVGEEMKPSSTERPGCVDLEDDAERRLFDGEKMHDVHAEARLVVERNLDLDGDGALDPLVTSNVSCGASACDYLMYVEHLGGCARFVGRFWGDPQTLERRPDGWLDVEFVSHGGYLTLSWLRYTGDRYQVHRIMHCPWGSPHDQFDAGPDSPDGCEEWHVPSKADDEL